jgi:phosphatidylinositol alpha-1,6-mannosyltransferase
LVLGASRLVPRKGFDVLIDAIAAIPEAQLMIVGDGRDRDRLESRASGARGRVTFSGPLSDDRLTEAYQAADVFAMPCRNRWGGLEQEGFGIVYNEAAAVGLPSVAGRSGGTHEAVVHDQTGFMVDGRSIAEVTEALQTLVGDIDLARSMGAAARARVVSELSYPVLAAHLSPLVGGDLTSLTTPAS